LGVFVGISWTEYHALARAHGAPLGTYTAQGAVLSVACGRWVFKHPTRIQIRCTASSLPQLSAAFKKGSGVLFGAWKARQAIPCSVFVHYMILATAC
jgi:hypothetical protein